LTGKRNSNRNRLKNPSPFSCYSFWLQRWLSFRLVVDLTLPGSLSDLGEIHAQVFNPLKQFLQGAVVSLFRPCPHAFLRISNLR